MKNQPLVSVVIATYNRKEYLVKAISSVFLQTYNYREIIIIDDGSTDGTALVVEGLLKKYGNISFIKNEKNEGFVKSLNKGVAAAHGEYIARLDDDDTWLDVKKIEKQVDFLEHNREYVLVGGGVIMMDKKGRETVRYLLPERDGEIRDVLLVDNVFAHSTVLFRREAFKLAGGYSQQFGFFADWALWLELGRTGKLYNFREFFIQYLDQENNKSNSNRDLHIRRKLLAKMALHKKYKNSYPRSHKALALSCASYCYSFMPFRKKLWPFIFRVRKLMFGNPPYTYSNNHEF